MLSDLSKQRHQLARVICGLIWLHVLINGVAAALAGADVTNFVLASLGVAVITTATLRFSPSESAVRLTTGIGLMITISLLLASMKGHRWQVDVHMYYFAALAIVAAYCDWRAILAATATVAVHHLALNFALPAAIYPGGADFGRVVLHAVILVCEAAGLTWMAVRLSTAMHTSQAALEQANAATAKAEAAAEAARQAADERARSEAQRREENERNALEQRKVVDLVADALGRLANRDLSHRLGRDMPEAYSGIVENFNTALAQVGDVIRAVSTQSDDIARHSNEISTSIDEMAKRTEQQTASLEKTAAALDQITATGRKTADNATHASNIVQDARTDAERTGEVLRKAVEAMGQIERSASQVNQIIGVIDEIAFQTNLLALNAGVEAARAGDAGRSFAVVASEVRALAQRSAEAAREIKQLISTSSTHVSAGVNLVADTGDALQRIVAQVQDINNAMIAITSGAKEQASGLAEVNAAIAQLESITQQNATMIDEVTGSSRSLSDQTGTLSARIGEFRVEGHAAQPTVPGRRRPQLQVVG